MQALAEVLWRPILAVVLLVLDPLRTVGGLILGLLAKPWWLVLPGAVILSIILEAAYVQFWAHEGGFNSLFMGAIVGLIAAWTGLSWRGLAPRLTGNGRSHG